MMERFAKGARVAVVIATEEARELSARTITASHLLLGVVVAADGPLAEALDDVGLTADALRTDLATRYAQHDVLGAADAAALESIGIDLAAVRSSVESRFGAGALDQPTPGERRRRFGRRMTGRIPFERGAKKALERSLREAVYRKDSSIEPEHIVLGLLRDADADLIALVERHEPVDALRLRIETVLDHAA